MSTLTAEQRARIERNRLNALQRKAAWQKQQQRQSNTNGPSHSTFPRKRKYHEITPVSRLPLHSISSNPRSSHTTNSCNVYPSSPQIKRRKLLDNRNDKNMNKNTTKHIETVSTSTRSQMQKKNSNRQSSQSTKPSKPRNKRKSNNLITNYFNDNRNAPNKTAKKKSKSKSKRKKRSTKRSKHRPKPKQIQKTYHKQWMPISKQALFDRLSHSKFRSKFKLGAKEVNIANTKNIESHAFDFVNKRLSAAYPTNDGKQTPMRGHPVFIAQHATATCCRTCLSKWHHIQIGKKLTNEQVIYMVEVVLCWIQRQLKTQSVTH
eukprot:244575_1